MPIAPKRRGGELRLEVLELALGAPALEPAVLERRDAGRIVAAVFEPLQRIDDRACDRPGPENPDNSAHLKVPVRIDRPRQALGHDGLVTSQIR